LAATPASSVRQFSVDKDETTQVIHTCGQERAQTAVHDRPRGTRAPVRACANPLASLLPMRASEDGHESGASLRWGIVRDHDLDAPVPGPALRRVVACDGSVLAEALRGQDRPGDSLALQVAYDFVGA